MAFPETHWASLGTMTLQGEENARSDYEYLCQQYWQPVFVALLSWGYSKEDAEDHTQGFFEYFLGKSILQRADRQQGKFRTFLLTILKRYLNDQRKRNQAEKRWGSQLKQPLEAADGELTADSEHFNRLLDYEWASNLIQKTLERIEAETTRRQSAASWKVLRCFLPGSRNVPTSEAAAALLGMKNSWMRIEVHRLRIRFRKELRHQLMATVSSIQELEEEIAYLGQVLKEGLDEQPTSRKSTLCEIRAPFTFNRLMNDR